MKEKKSCTWTQKIMGTLRIFAKHEKPVGYYYYYYAYFLHGRETWLLTLREERRLRVFNP